MANTYLRRFSTSYVLREMQIKTMIYHYTPIRMSEIQKPKTEEDVEQQEPSLFAGGNANDTAQLEDCFAVLYKVKHGLTIWSRSCPPVYLPK